MELKERQKEAISLINMALRCPSSDQASKAFYALGYIRPLLEESVETVTTEDVERVEKADSENRSLKLEIISLSNTILECKEKLKDKDSEIESLKNEIESLKRMVETEDNKELAVVFPNKKVKTLEEYCEEKKEQLKHDVIAEEDKTLYLHRAYLKDEICKRFPKTNMTIKRILNGHGITNIEEFYEHYTDPDNWYDSDNWGIAAEDCRKLQNLYITLNEESGCLAEDKFKAYIQKITGRDDVTRIVNALGRGLNIHTKAQLRYYIKEKCNNVMFRNVRGLSVDNADKIYNYVMEEISLHMV